MDPGGWTKVQGALLVSPMAPQMHNNICISSTKCCVCRRSAILSDMMMDVCRYSLTQTNVQVMYTLPAEDKHTAMDMLVSSVPEC